MEIKQLNELKSMLLRLDEKVSYLVAEKRKDKLTPKETQEMLGISRSTYQRYVKDGVFEQKKIKGKAYVQRSDIERLIEEGKI